MGHGSLLTPRGAFVLILSAVLLMSSLVPVHAQRSGLINDTTYVSDYGLTISWSPRWTYDAEHSIRSTPDAPLFEYEMVYLVRDASVMVVVIGDGYGFAWCSRDRVLGSLGGEFDALTLVDAGQSDTQSWWLDNFPRNGVAYGAISATHSTADQGAAFLTVFLGPVSGFAERMAQAQAEISIDGQRALQGFDGHDLQTSLDAMPITNWFSTPVTDASPNGSTPSPDATPDSGTADAGKDSEYADAGMVGRGHYVSPQFNTEVRWRPSWELDDRQDPPVVSDRQQGRDRVHITLAENTWVILEVVTFSADGKSIEDLVDYFSSPTAVSLYFCSSSLDGLGQPSVDVVQASATRDRGGVVYRNSSAFIPIIYYSEYRLANGGEAVVEAHFSADLPGVETGLGAAQTGVTVNGEPVLTYYTVDEVLAEPAS